MLHLETVDGSTLGLLKKLMADPELNGFHLVGGTALALQIGHRKSVDLDLFTGAPFDSEKLLNHLKANYEVRFDNHIKSCIWCFIDDVKVDLITHEYPIIEPLLKSEGIRMAGLDEIGAMKLHAVVQSGRRLKDFVDLYYLLEQRPFQLMAKSYEQKYPDTNIAIAKSGLAYHQNINFTVGSIELLKSDPGWSRMAARLNEATAHTLRIFKPFGQRPNKGLRP
jgi:hypothetical protein